MGAAPKVDLLASHWLASHWLSLRETPLRVTVRGRAQAREAWRIAAAEYERSAQSALADADDDASAPPPAAPVRNQHPG